MTRIAPPKDYVQCDLCKTWRPKAKTRSVPKFFPAEGGGPTEVPICSDEVNPDGEPGSRFCRRTRGLEDA